MAKILSEKKTGVVKIEISVFLVGLAMVLLLLVPADASPTRDFEVVMPKECQDNGFCTKPYNDFIRQRIEKLLIEDYKVMLGDVYEHFNDREGYADIEQNDCKKNSHWDPIYEIYDENNQVRAVVQSEKHFMQILKIETCANPGERLTSPTKHFSKSQLQMHNITCQQDRLPYTFLVLSLDGSSLEMVSSKYEIPINCACVLETNTRRRRHHSKK